MKLIRYSCVSSIPSKKTRLFDFDFVDKVRDDVSLTDRSRWIPQRDLSKTALLRGSVSPESYQFPDGKDDGSEVPISVRRGADLAELSTSIHNEQVAIDSKIKAAQKEAKEMNELKARIKGELNNDASSSST